jgi:DNA-binding transcriptional LysR family regulator
MIAEARAGENAVRNKVSEPVGTVRVSLPVAMADVILSHLLPKFMKQYPQVRLKVQATNRNVDLIEESIDVAVRGVGLEVESSSLVQATLGSVRWAMVASPAYLRKRQPIESLKALSDADVLLYSSINEAERAWQLVGPNGARQAVQINSLRLQTDNMPLLRSAVLAGMGVAGVPLYACSSEVAAGKLVVVLPDWRPRVGRLVVLFPTRRGLASAVRVFVAFLKAELADLQ